MGSRHARENRSSQQQHRKLDCHLNRDWAGPQLLLPSSEVEIAAQVTVHSIKLTKNSNGFGDLGGNGDLIIPIFYFEKIMVVCWGLDLIEYFEAYDHVQLCHTARAFTTKSPFEPA